jgi:hypothetical protein
MNRRQSPIATDSATATFVNRQGNNHPSYETTGVATVTLSSSAAAAAVVAAANSHGSNCHITNDSCRPRGKKRPLRKEQRHQQQQQQRLTQSDFPSLKWHNYSYYSDHDKYYYLYLLLLLLVVLIVVVVGRSVQQRVPFHDEYTLDDHRTAAQ